MQDFSSRLEFTVKELFGVDFTPEVTVAPVGVEADYASNVALKLAKELHRTPMEIANEIAAKIPGAVAVTPGFVNFISSDEYLIGEIEEYVDDFEKNISSDEYSGKTVVCEFSDPNPFKVLHVGHLYTSVVGDAISRLYEYAGAKVVRANFGGDVGLHVAKTLYAMRASLLERSSASADELTIEDIAKCYVAGTAMYEEDEVARAEITKLNKEIYRINAENIHGTELADLYWRGRELSYEYFKDFYAKIGVKFDKFYPESSVTGIGLEKVRAGLVAGVYEKSDGAVIFDGEKYGLHTRVFINSEGVPTYEAKDVGLIFAKWEDYHFDRSVVITGSEQLEYMKVVLKSVEQYAPELVERTTHLTHGLVKLPGNVKMSSRKGNFLKAVDVLEMVAGLLREGYNSEDERVTMAATKYAFLKYKMGGNIVFDPKESVKMTGNSGPYLLYATVRAKKILEKVTATGGERGVLLVSERNLMKKILEYKGVLAEAVREMAPHRVANYLYELAQGFSRFYEECPVVGAPEEAERAKLVRVYYNVMKHGLGVLGIEVPEEM